MMVSPKNTERSIAMIRREKGFKRYAQQRERRYTDPLIRDGEYEQAIKASERIAARSTGFSGDRDDVLKNKGELTDYE